MLISVNDLFEGLSFREFEVNYFINNDFGL